MSIPAVVPLHTLPPRENGIPTEYKRNGPNGIGHGPESCRSPNLRVEVVLFQGRNRTYDHDHIDSLQKGTSLFLFQQARHLHNNPFLQQ